MAASRDDIERKLTETIQSSGLDDLQKKSLQDALVKKLAGYDLQLKGIADFKDFKPEFKMQPQDFKPQDVVTTLFHNLHIMEKKDAAAPAPAAAVAVAAAPAAAGGAPAPAAAAPVAMATPLTEGEVNGLIDEIASESLNSLATAFFTALQNEFKGPPVLVDNKLFDTHSKDQKAINNVKAALVPPSQDTITNKAKALAKTIKEEKKIEDDPLDAKDAKTDFTTLKTALTQIRTNYITTTDTILTRIITSLETNADAKALRVAAPGIDLSLIKPPPRDEKAQPTILSLKTEMIKDEKGFPDILKTVIESDQEFKAGVPNALVTAENLVTLTSLNHQYRALKAVNEIVTNLPIKLVEDTKDLKLDAKDFVALKTSEIINLLSAQLMEGAPPPDKKEKTAALENTLVNLLKEKKQLKNPLNNFNPPINDNKSIAILETSRQNYQAAFLQGEIAKATQKISDIKPTIDILSADQKEIKADALTIASDTINQQHAQLKTISDKLKELKDPNANQADITASQDQIKQQLMVLQRYEAIIKPFQEAHAKDVEMAKSLDSITPDIQKFIKGEKSKTDYATAKKEVEKAVAQLPNIIARLNEKGPYGIRIEETRAGLTAVKDKAEKLQTDWTKKWGQTLEVPKTVDSAKGLRSQDPHAFKLELPSNHHHALKQLFDIYTYNWEMAKDAKVIGGNNAQGQPNEYLKALNAAIDKKGGPKTKLDLHIDAIKTRLVNLTLGEHAGYQVKNPKNKDEVDEAAFLVTAMKNLQTLQAEMIEIHQEVTQRAKPTHTISAFGAEPQTFSSSDDFNTKVKEWTGKPIDLRDEKDKSHLVARTRSEGSKPLYLESLSDAPPPGIDYDRWTLYTPPADNKGVAKDPSIPLIYSHESRTGGMRKSEDGILSIDPTISDHVLLAKILAKHTTLVADVNNQNQAVPRNKLEAFWLEQIEAHGAPKCLDDKEKLKELVKGLAQTFGDVFEEPLGNYTIGNEINRRTENIATLLDGHRYNKNGLPIPQFADLAKKYLESKYQQIQEGRCPAPVELFSNSKPIMQAWGCILANSPEMNKVFRISPQSKKFDATPAQKELSKKFPGTYLPMEAVAKRAEEMVNKDPIPAQRRWFGR